MGRGASMPSLCRVFVSLAACATLAHGATLSCSASASLEALVTCVVSYMPGSGSNIFVEPTSTEITSYKDEVQAMINGTCSSTLPSSLSGFMTRYSFTDDKTYCVLQETLDNDNDGLIDRGFGTIIVNASPVRHLIHAAPHPMYDSTTEQQAITVFKQTDSEVYMLAGTHRLDSSTAACSGQTGYTITDVAHDVRNMFHAATEQLFAHFSGSSNDWAMIQWHGMAASTCSEHVFPVHGYDGAPIITDKISDIFNSLKYYHPTWVVGQPGTSTCSLLATTNTQGRLINGVAASSVCNTYATSYSRRFIHIEQDSGYRGAADWINTVNDIWNTGVPSAPSSLTATAGRRKADLKFVGSVRVSSYTVQRATNAAGPWTNIATGLTTMPSSTGYIAYSASGLTTGTTYYFQILAVNAAGSSAASNMASATAT